MSCDKVSGDRSVSHSTLNSQSDDGVCWDYSSRGQAQPRPVYNVKENFKCALMLDSYVGFFLFGLTLR